MANRLEPRGTAKSTVKPLKMFPYYRDQFGKITGLGVLSFFSAYFQAAALILVVPLATVISRGAHRYVGKLGPFKVEATTGTLVAIAAVAIVAAAITDIWIAWASARMRATWEFNRREQVVYEYLHADFQTQSAERLGTLGTITGFVSRGAAALGSIVSGIEAALTIGTFVAAALLIDYRAALFLLGTVAVLSFLLRPVMVLTKKYSRALSAILIEYGRDVTEATRMVRDVRIFSAADPLGERLTGISRQVADVRKRSGFVGGLTSPVYQYLGMLLIVGALAFAQAQHLSSSELAKLGAIALLLLRSLSFGQQLQSAYQNFIDCVPYVEKLENMRDVYLAHAEQDGTVPLESIHTLELDDVGYTYDGRVDALAGVSASFRVGEIVGIVGPSGSGKSTLSQLILRLREPTRGEIRVNAVPVGEYTLASWYRHVSLVPQDPRLLHGTVAENIAFLNSSIGREQVIAAARAAGVHDVIVNLDEGYDTIIGPAFRDLSGGQIQRIGIARALARGAQVLVLDEPTSALDVHSEGVIQATLEGLRGQVLTMIIAHRLSTLSICDRIVVTRDGKIETMGTLSEVSERSDFFKRALDAGTLEIGISDQPVVAPDDV